MAEMRKNLQERALAGKGSWAAKVAVACLGLAMCSLSMAQVSGARGNGSAGNGHSLFKANKAALLSDLARVGGLAGARLEFVQAKAEDGYFEIESSSSTPDARGGCAVRLAAEASGHFTMVASIRWDLGLEASPEMERSLNLFEALHELSHCAMARGGLAFGHRALDKEGNQALGYVLAAGKGGGLLAESFADARAGLSMLEDARRHGRSLSAELDALELARAWRARSRSGREHALDGAAEIESENDILGGGGGEGAWLRAALADARGRLEIRDVHESEQALGKLLTDPSHGLGAQGSLSSRAMEIASASVCDALFSAKYSDESRPENIVAGMEASMERGSPERVLARRAQEAWGRLIGLGALERVEPARPVVELAVMRMVAFGKASRVH